MAFPLFYLFWTFVGAIKGLCAGPAHLFSGSPIITSEKLNDNNYSSWYAFVECWFLGQGLHDQLKRTTTKYHHVLNSGRRLPTLCSAMEICGTFYIRDPQHSKHVNPFGSWLRASFQMIFRDFMILPINCHFSIRQFMI